MVGITKLRIKFGPEGSVKAFQTFNNCTNAKSTENKPIGKEEEDVQSRKRGPEELEEVQAHKKQKLNRVLSSQCLNLLKSLRGHEFGWLFGEPVDPVKLNIPDYFSVISKPMDLGTISSKLLKNVYSSADEFAADVRLTFDNALRYNPPENFVHDVAKELLEIFEARWESLRKKKVSDLHGEKVTEGSSFRRQPVEVGWIRQSSPETSASSGRFSVELPKQAKEKSQKVPLLLKPVTKLSKKDTPVVTPAALATKLRIKKFEQGHGSTVENPSKGLIPTSACKCSSCGRITCRCLKSCNSSGSEVSTLTDYLVKDNSCSQASESDPHSNGSISSKNDCVSSQLDTPLDNELKKPLPPMPPLPPEKAIRAAILKCQFAETILKAKHRKVLDKNNKSDLIRIQIEKEQMEKTQREEKARIEAEIAAARLATRMRAEAELKEKRERERLELEKMVKEVDLEENNASKFNENMINLCGSCDPTRTWLPELGLFLINDDDDSDEDDSEVSDAMRIDDLEEGEIL